VKKGEDPAAAKQARRQAANVSQLCDLYLADAEAGRLLTRRKKAKKPSTLEIDKGRIERHIKPLLGRLKVTAVTSGDIDNFMHDVAEGRTAGNTKSAKKRGLARVRGGKTHSHPHGRPSRRDIQLCRPASHTPRQSGARRRPLRGWEARAPSHG
jgi:hypothetical protein